VNTYKVKLVKLLVKNGSDININYNCCYYPIARFLVRKGMAVNRSKIITYGSYEQISKLDNITFDEACANFETTKAYKGDIINQSDVCGATLLHYAAQAGDPKWVKYLLDRGADQFAKDVDGQVAVNSLFQGRFTEGKLAVYSLLRRSINEPDRYGRILVTKIKVIKYLIGIGADYKTFPIVRRYNYFTYIKLGIDDFQTTV
jgi:ankyrin repeat protein